MDTSPEYVKMCEEANEIQKRRPLGCFPLDIWEDGDYFAVGAEVRVFHHIAFDEGYIEDLIRERGRVWLPQQDQLQKMIIDCIRGVPNEYKWYVTFQGMLRWLKKSKTNLSVEQHFNSMEQLWFAFVMKNVYNKTWDSVKEEWIPNGLEGRS